MANDTSSTRVMAELDRLVPGGPHRAFLGGDAATTTGRRASAADTGAVRGDSPPRFDVLDLPPHAPFPIPRRREFVEPEFVAQGGHADADYAPLVDFIPAPDVAAVGRFIAAKYQARFPHLFAPCSQRVDYLWKRAGGQSAGRDVLGKCVKSGSLARYYARLADPQATWTIWIAADNCAGATAQQLHALVLHQLLHTGMNPNLQPKITGHDLEEFRFVVEEYGFWDDSLRAFRRSVQQRSLFEGRGDQDDDERQEDPA